MEPAPLYHDLARGPDPGQAFWVRAGDGVRLRIALWHRAAEHGTVLLFPGRTEYVEKYGITATDLAGAGLATLTIDWRGQGLADRLIRNPILGHVGRFGDYQLDVAALAAAARTLGLPQPWYLLSHSMGGAIGLRGLLDGLPVRAAAFSAPMWGIRMSPALRALAWGLSWAGTRTGLGHMLVPSATRRPYVLSEPFADNQLTSDADMYARMIRHLETEPALALGGPTLGWLYEALCEARDLSRRDAPAIPCLALLGSHEDIVCPDSIRARMARWPGGRLETVDGGRHEVLMETPDRRQAATALIARHFRDHR